MFEPNPEHPARVTLDKLALLHDFMLVRPLAPPSKGAGSLIHIPDAAKAREHSQRAIVLAVGPGDWNEQGTAVVPMRVPVGALVYHGKYAGTEESFDRQNVLVMRERELRLWVSEGHYQLVEHPEAPHLAHLIEDYCDLCHGAPAEAAAKSSLATLRDDLARERQMADTVDARGPVPVVAGDDDRLERMQQLMFTKRGLLPTQFTMTDDQRPCLVDGCANHKQTRLDVQGADGTASLWAGLVCGHVSDGLFRP